MVASFLFGNTSRYISSLELEASIATPCHIQKRIVTAFSPCRELCCCLPTRLTRTVVLLPASLSQHFPPHFSIEAWMGHILKPFSYVTGRSQTTNQRNFLQLRWMSALNTFQAGVPISFSSWKLPVQGVFVTCCEPIATISSPSRSVTSISMAVRVSWAVDRAYHYKAAPRIRFWS